MVGIMTEKERSFLIPGSSPELEVLKIMPDVGEPLTVYTRFPENLGGKTTFDRSQLAKILPGLTEAQIAALFLHHASGGQVEVLDSSDGELVEDVPGTETETTE